MEAKPIKICILGATFNTQNMGVSMLAAGAIRCVLHRFPHARIAMLDYAYGGYEFDFLHDGAKIPIRFVNLRFSKKVYLGNNVALLILLVLISKVIPSAAVRRNLLSRNRYLGEVLQTDIFFAVSGGDSFSDIYGVGRFLYVALPQLLALFAGKRLICLPQTIGPFRFGIVRVIAKFILNHAEVVYSRDQVGLDATRRLLGRGAEDGKLRFCYDLAFDVDAAQTARVEIVGFADEMDSTTSLVGFNVSGLLLAGGYTRDNMFRFKVDYADLVHRLIGFLIEERSAKVLLVPHVFGSSARLESDIRACEAVYERLRDKYAGHIGLVRGSFSHDEIKYVIGLCDFFVGARMHACIGAVSQHIPTVPISYSDKFAGVMETIGLGDFVVDPRRMTVEEAIRVLDHAYDRQRSVRLQLKNVIPSVKEKIRNALADIPDPSSMLVSRECANRPAEVNRRI